MEICSALLEIRESNAKVPSSVFTSVSLHHFITSSLSFSFLICCIFYPNKILEYLEKNNSFQRIILDFYYKHSRQEAKDSKTQKTIKESRAESPISFASDNFIFRLIFLISQFCLFEDVPNIL